jgi:hypothetical protein
MIEPIKKVKHKLPSNRSFGLLMVFVGLLLSAWSYNKSRLDISTTIAYGACALLLITLLLPKALYPFNRAWHEFGLLLGRIVSPVVLGLIFYCLITPIAIIVRGFGRDPLNLKSKGNHKTFWTSRSPKTIPADSFKNQF